MNCPMCFGKIRKEDIGGANQNQAVNLGFSSPSDFIGKTIFEILEDQESAQAIEDADQKVMRENKVFILEEKMTTPVGEKYYLSQKSPIHGENGEVIGMFGLSMDITELKQSSIIDPLTQLHNRRGLEKAMNDMISRRRRHDGHFSVVMLDLDGFKGLNDSKGHSSGDKALISCAAILRNQLRQTDMIFRMGGDEFLIFMPNTEAIDCDSLCSTLCHKICTELTQEFDYPLSASIGFTTVESSSAISANTLSVADRALYQAKDSGKGCVVRGYAEEMNEQEIVY